MGYRIKATQNSDFYKESVKVNDDIKEQDLGTDLHHYKSMGGFEFFPAAKVRDSDWKSVFLYIFIYLIIGLAILVFVDMFFNGYSFKDLFNFN